MSATIDPNLAIGAGLFVLGTIGVLTRRNLIVIVLSAEMMLHAVALTLVTFSKQHGNNAGQVFTIFVLTVAACEAGLALALVLALYQRTKTLDINIWTANREPDLPGPAPDDYASPAMKDIFDMPRLTPAGRGLNVEGSERTLLAESELRRPSSTTQA
jgi:NADH-quinone oxidoreductase subunit K